MKIRDLRIYNDNQEYLVKLREEYTLYGDFRTSLERGCLTVHAYRRAAPKKKKVRPKYDGSDSNNNE